jgi:hypothetical protein
MPFPFSVNFGVCLFPKHQNPGSLSLLRTNLEQGKRNGSAPLCRRLLPSLWTGLQSPCSSMLLSLQNDILLASIRPCLIPIEFLRDQDYLLVPRSFNGLRLFTSFFTTVSFPQHRILTRGRVEAFSSTSCSHKLSPCMRPSQIYNHPSLPLAASPLWLLAQIHCGILVPTACATQCAFEAAKALIPRIGPRLPHS